MKLIKKVLSALYISNSGLDVDAYRRYIFNQEEIDATRLAIMYATGLIIVMAIALGLTLMAMSYSMNEALLSQDQGSMIEALASQNIASLITYPLFFLILIMIVIVSCLRVPLSDPREGRLNKVIKEIHAAPAPVRDAAQEYLRLLGGRDLITIDVRVLEKILLSQKEPPHDEKTSDVVKASDV